MIDAQAEGFLGRFLPVEARRHGACILALGMVADHVHLVLRLSVVSNIPRLVQGFKGASARLINHSRGTGRPSLKWASGYDLRSVSPSQLDRVIAYVRQQAERHPRRATDPT
jgi:putative transposase